MDKYEKRALSRLFYVYNLWTTHMSRGIHHLFVDNFLNTNENHLHYHSYLTWTTGIDLIADANDYHSHYHSYLAGENHSHLVVVPRGTTGCGRVWGEVRIILILILIAILIWQVRIIRITIAILIPWVFHVEQRAG